MPARESGASVERIHVLGVRIDRIPMDGLVERVAEAIAGDGRLRILVANANKVWQASRDARLRRILADAELVVPEWAMTWAAARLGAPGVPCIRGIALMQRLLSAAADRGWSVYLLGGRPGVAERASARLQCTHPRLRIAGYQHGFLDQASERRLRAELCETAPDIVFVAKGSPRQEYWIGELPASVAPAVCMGVGGSLDVLAGLKREAPSWMQGRGLEWLYRMAREPRRLGARYLVTNSWLLWSVARARAGRAAGEPLLRASGRPRGSDARPGPSGARPRLSGDQPGPSDDWPGPSDARPRPSDDPPRDSHARPGPSDDRPRPSGDQPGPSDARPGPSDARPRPSGDQPGPSDDRPGPSDARPPASPGSGGQSLRGDDRGARRGRGR